MLCVVMAVLTKIDDLLDQECFVATTMRRMARGAIFLHGWVFPDPGAALVGMAFVAELVRVFSRDHFFGKRTMGVVAVRALDLALDDRMV